MDFLVKILEIAERLSQGGVVLILVAFVGALMYALIALFRVFTENNNRVIAVLESTARTIEANTIVVDKATEMSEANKSAIEGLTRALLERRK